MAFYILYIFLLLGKMLLLRIKHMKSKAIPKKFFKSYQGCEIPEECVIHSRHFDNQFQLPVLFFISCLVSLVIIPDSFKLVYLAWSFVVSRIVHSVIHLGYNHPIHRAVAYSLGWIIVLAMWVVMLI